MSRYTWEVGQKVYILPPAGWGNAYERAKEATIEKVYKNGNAIVGGAQYRPDGYGTGRFVRQSIVPVTDKTSALFKEAAQELSDKILAAKLIDYVGKVNRNFGSKATIALFTSDAVKAAQDESAS